MTTKLTEFTFIPNCPSCGVRRARPWFDESLEGHFVDIAASDIPSLRKNLTILNVVAGMTSEGYAHEMSCAVTHDLSAWLSDRSLSMPLRQGANITHGCVLRKLKVTKEHSEEGSLAGRVTEAMMAVVDRFTDTTNRIDGIFRFDGTVSEAVGEWNTAFPGTAISCRALASAYAHTASLPTCAKAVTDVTLAAVSAAQDQLSEQETAWASLGPDKGLQDHLDDGALPSQGGADEAATEDGVGGYVPNEGAKRKAEWRS